MTTFQSGATRLWTIHTIPLFNVKALMHVSKPIFWIGHSLAPVKRAVWFVVTLMLLHLNLHAQPGANPPRPLPIGPEHPAVDASDADWNLWLEKHATWMQNLEYYTRNAIIAETAENLAKKSSSYDWRLESRLRGLTWNQIQALASGGVVATGRELYLGVTPEKPMEGVFVTSDMMLHAYNMMVADFVRGIEMQRAPRLRRSLEEIWAQMDQWIGLYGKHPELAKSGLAHAQRVIGTALLCLGSKFNFRDVDVERDCRAQMQLIMSATATELSAWLEPADGDFGGIDYMRMKPVGIYTENKTLSDLFRAVRWLQVVPFRPQRDRELIAFAILADKAESSGLIADENVQRQWLGLPNCLTVSGHAWLSKQVVAALQDTASTVNLEGVRANLAKQDVPVHANDDVRFDPGVSGRSVPSPLLKIFPAYLTADSLLFSQILLSSTPSRLPEGRMITAYLGDVPAIADLQQAGWNEATLGLIRKASSQRLTAWAADANNGINQNPYDDHATFNSMLLHTLAALFLPPPEGSPAFMAGPAWWAKTRNTVLSAWAEKKHTWVLHEVEPKGYTAGRPLEPPSGLIEPNPEFFHRLASLAEKNIQWMEQNHYLRSEGLSDNVSSRAANYLSIARLVHELSLDTNGNPNNKVNWDDFVDKISWQGVVPPHFPSEAQWAKLTAADFEKLRESALLSAEAIIHGLDPESNREDVIHPPDYRRDRWTMFLKCVRLLEKMSERQLRNEEWNQEEREYLTFGIWNDYYSVAHMGDNGQVPDPQSMGPKIAPVASDPNSGLVLHVGTGDMSEIYVLYPWKGSFYLYRGPIIPYYELSSKTRLDDQEWRALLKSEKAPLQPEWLAPLGK